MKTIVSREVDQHLFSELINFANDADNVMWRRHLEKVGTVALWRKEFQERVNDHPVRLLSRS